MTTRPGTTPDGNINRTLLKGAAWSVALRWCVRGIGFVSVIIIARLLTPEDLGLVAMAGLLIGLLQQFSNLGVSAHLIRVAEATREHCDSAWTMNITQNTLIALVAAATAPWAAEYFREPRLVPVTYMLAAAIFVSGFENIGMVLVRRELDFARDFRYLLYTRFVTFFATVTLALLLRSYWAIAVAQLITSMAELAFSYRMHAYRPALSIAKLGEYLRFGAHILPLSIGTYFSRKLGPLVVGRVASTATFGSFNVMSDLSGSLVQEIVTPLNRALLPSYAKSAHDKPKLLVAYLEMLRAVALVCIPMGIGLSLVADDLVLALLGSQWVGHAPLLPWLAGYATAAAMGNVLTGQILIVTGNERRALISTWIDIGIAAPTIIVGGAIAGVDGVVRGMLLATLLSLPIKGYILGGALDVSLARLFACAARPLLAGVAMALVMRVIPFDVIHQLHARLALQVLAGATIYGVAVIALWWLRGRPPGPERLALTLLAGRLGIRGRER